MGDKPSVASKNTLETDVDELDLTDAHHDGPSGSCATSSERSSVGYFSGFSGKNDGGLTTGSGDAISSPFQRQSTASDEQVAELPCRVTSPKKSAKMHESTSDYRETNGEMSRHSKSKVKSPVKTSPTKSENEAHFVDVRRASQSSEPGVTESTDDLESHRSIEPPSPSTSSTVTVIHVSDGLRQPAKGGPIHSIGHPLAESTRTSCASPCMSDAPFSRDRNKQTLGDLLSEIEVRSGTLLRQTNYMTPTVVADLQFLAQQSRYNTDANIKRRIITKLVDSGLIDIIQNVFKSLSGIDYFKGNVKQPTAVGPSGAAASCLAASVDSAMLEDDADRDSDISEGLLNLRSAITLAWNASDKSTTLCEQCVRRGIVLQFLKLLDDPNFAISELGDRNRMYIVKGCLGLLSSIVRSCDDDITREAFRASGAVKSLQQFVRCSQLALRTKALMILSYIVTESENDVINATDRNLVFAVKILQTAVECENHYSSKYGYWAVEIITGINRLACFESNKERLHACGLLMLCYRLLEGGCSDDEMLVAAQTFWILSFNCNVRNDVLGCLQYMEVLQRLSVNATRDEIKTTASSALWVLNHHNSISQPVTDRERDNSRILIISHHTSGPVVIKIRNHLRGLGYHVHIDPDLRSGNSGMAHVMENVDRAGVLLVFLSNRLKNSPACRTELEYAVNTKMPIVPVRTNRSFVADGWLSLAVGSLSIVDHVETEDAESAMSNLMRHVAAVTGFTVGPTPVVLRSAGSAVSASTDHSCRSSTTRSEAVSLVDVTARTSDTNIATWTHKDVETWLRNNELDIAIDRLGHLTGDLLLEVKRMQTTAPEAFYSSLRKDLSLDFVSVLKFTRALSRL